MPKESAPNVDIFDLLAVNDKDDKQRRKDILASSGVKEYFAEGEINIDKRTCHGVECKLCVKACPTNALYWKTSGEVGIVKDLCVYCGACVLSCMVDDCIKIRRKRENGKTEKFSKKKDVIGVEEKINAQKRFERIKEVFPNADAFCERYNRKK
jgi:ferredoxin